MMSEVTVIFIRRTIPSNIIFLLHLMHAFTECQSKRWSSIYFKLCLYVCITLLKHLLTISLIKFNKNLNCLQIQKLPALHTLYSLLTDPGYINSLVLLSLRHKIPTVCYHSAG